MLRQAGEETVACIYFCRDVVPFAAMIAVECAMVGSYTLFKAATLRELSFYVFFFYSYVVATLVLLPVYFTLKGNLLNRFMNEILGFVGVT